MPYYTSSGSPPSTRQTWTREQRLGIALINGRQPKITFSGLTITTTQFGTQPWFELAYQCLATPDDRRRAREQKRAAGDTHIILEYTTRAGSVYNESDVWLQTAVSMSAEADPAWFKGLIDEILSEGAESLVPVIVYDGDNGMADADGYPNALRQLPILAALLDGYDDSVVYARFWDGVFYGSTPESIQAFGRAFRARYTNPNAVLIIEHNPGHIPVGNGPADYEADGMMAEYDGIASEYDYPGGIAAPPAIVGAQWNDDHGLYVPVYASDETPWTNIWQVVARCSPAWTPPPDEPFNVPAVAVDGPQRGQTVIVSADNPRPASYLKPSARGPRAYWALELAEYEWTRNRVSVGSLQQAGRYFRAMGCPFVGLP
jgi:hypothetical protein